MSATVLNRIELVLGANATEISARCSKIFNEVAGPYAKRIVLAGAGFYGLKTLQGLRAAGVEPLAFIDNNPAKSGSHIDGCQVLTAAEAFAQFENEAVYVVTVFNGSPMRKQLAELGCERIASTPSLYWAYTEQFLPYGGISEPNATLPYATEVEAAHRLWHDDFSREVYLTQLQWRQTLDDALLTPPTPAVQTYYLPEIRRIENERFVDCGAFDGDSIEAFFAEMAGPKATAIAIEPDPRNNAALRARMQRIGHMEDVSVLNFAVSDQAGELTFDATGTAASSLTGAGSTTVKCDRLDTLLTNEAPTFIKMDIEGAELSALHGAAETIRKHQPVLAICLYHKPEDLWVIPNFVASLGVDYRYALRAHAEECWELVLYAVPADRWSSNGK